MIDRQNLIPCAGIAEGVLNPQSVKAWHLYSLVGFYVSNPSQLRSNAELLFYLVHPERRRHSMKNIVSTASCWTGRKWLNIGRGWLAIGFGPRKFIERIWFRGKLVWRAKP